MSPVSALCRASSLAVLSVLTVLVVAAPEGAAQTPAAAETLLANARGSHRHAVNVHNGTCAARGDVAISLNDLVPPAGEWSGPDSAVPVALSENVIDMPLQDIIDGGHAINVYLSAGAIDQHVACGDIGGVIATDEGGRREMMIGLAEMNSAGYTGTVWLGPGADNTQTEISVILLEPAP